MSKIYGYIRVSTNSQAESGLGLQDQTRVIASRQQQLAEQHGVEVGEVYIEAGVSASKYDLLDRPAGRRLNETLGPSDHIIFAKLDRGFRNMADCVVTMADWDKRQVLTHILDLGVDTSTPSGQLMVGIMASFAHFEVRRMAERTRSAKQAMRINGQSTNGVRRLGYDIVEGLLVPHSVERAIASRVVVMRRDGLFWRQIAERLNTDGTARPGGFAHAEAAWTPQAVSRLAKAHTSNWP